MSIFRRTGMYIAVRTRRLIRAAAAQIRTVRSLSSQPLIPPEISQLNATKVNSFLHPNTPNFDLDTVKRRSFATNGEVDSFLLQMTTISKVLDEIERRPESQGLLFQIFAMRLLMRSAGLAFHSDFKDTSVLEDYESTNEWHFDEDLEALMREITSEISGKEFVSDDIRDFWQRILSLTTLARRPVDDKNITKDEVVSRVLDVIKCFPKLDHSKLTEEGHYEKDLGLDKESWNYIVSELEEEFDLKNIPKEVQTVKLVIECIYEAVQSQSYEGDDPTVDQIKSTATLVVKILDDFIKYRRRNSDDEFKFKLYAKAFELSIRLSKHYPSLPEKLQLFTSVFDQIQNYPLLGKSLVYQARMFIKTMSIDDGKDDVTREQVISRVLDVIRNHPKIVNPVTDESDFENDLGLSDVDDQHSVRYALRCEFKLEIPDDIESCKDAIDYVYKNRMKRWSLEEFDDNFGFSMRFCLDA